MSEEETAQERWAKLERAPEPPTEADLGLDREVRVHQCRCLLVHPIDPEVSHPYLNRCERMLPVDQPLCGNCEAVHLTQIDPIFYSGAYMMLVPPEFP